MIQKQTKLIVADNSGAKELMVIHVSGGTRKRFAYLGDVVKVTVKKAIPGGTVKKKEVLNAVKEKKKSKTLIVGDDLTTTNLKRVHRAVQGGAINAMIVKPNQIGSILEVKKVVEFCKKNDIVMIFSHRSGETMDDTLADYCVGFGGQFMKAGIYGRERLIKLKRVIDIEKALF